MPAIYPSEFLSSVRKIQTIYSQKRMSIHILSHYGSHAEGSPVRQSVFLSEECHLAMKNVDYVNNDI
jgi:hypothetical protein